MSDEVKKEAAAEAPAKDAVKSNQNLMLGAVAAIVLLAVGIGAFVLLGGSDTKTVMYEGEDYTVDYPEEWTVEDSGGDLTIVSASFEDMDPEDLDNLSIVTVQISDNSAGSEYMDEEELDEERENRQLVKDGDCADMKEKLEDSFDESALALGGEFTLGDIKNAKVNDYMACRVDMEVDMGAFGEVLEGLSMTAELYVMVSDDLEESYTLMIMNMGDTGSDTNKAKDVIDSFELV